MTVEDGARGRDVLHLRRSSRAADATGPASTVAADRGRGRRTRRPAVRSVWVALVLVAAAVAAAVVAYLPFTWTPQVVPASAPATVFSAERAMDDLRAVASQPRSIGTPAHEATIDTIQSRLDAMDVESHVVEDVVAVPDFGQVFAGRLRNVIARIPGTDSTGAVLLVSHYDSLPTSMNANDGGLGVATALETVRALQSGPAPANDVVVWFGDADETTAMNTRILQRHPWFDDVRIGFAFEAIGVRGPSLLSYAGQGDPAVDAPARAVGENEGLALGSPQLTTVNGRWLREALEVVPHPVVALGLSDAAIGLSPDLGVAMFGSDLAGVSFSQVGDSSGYHTRLDNPDRVAPSSLQDAGDTSLALTRHFAALDFADVEPAPRLIAFTVAPGWIVTYPASWAVPLALVAGGLLVAVIVVGRRRRRLTLPATAIGVVLVPVSVVAAAVLAAGVTGLLAPEVRFARNPYGAGWRTLLLAALALACVAVVYLGVGRLMKTRARRTALAAGALAALGIVGVLVSWALPALSYVFVWPTLAVAVLLAWMMLRPGQASLSWAATAGLAVVGAATMVVAVPLVYLLASAVSVAQPMFAAIIAAVTALLAAVLVPHFQYLTGGRAWVVPLVLVGAVVGFAGASLVAGRFDADQPRPNHIQYTLDADTGEATWVSAATRLDAWTDQFFTDEYTTGRAAFSPGYFFGQTFDVIRADAPTVDLPPPRLMVLDDTTTAGVRTLRLRVASSRGAAMVHADLDLPGGLVAAVVDGDAVPVDEDAALRRFPIAVYNPGDEGVEVTLSVRGSGPITGTLTDFTNGLPAIPGMSIAGRPPQFMPAPFDFRDPTVVHTTVRL